jgi:hemerythrin-like domain-containing protein
MNPIQLIKQDHRMVKGLFRKFERASRSADRQKIGQEIIEELSVHSAIEEQLLYPLTEARGPQMHEPVLHALEEHHAVKLTLAELDGMSAEDERYAAKMHVVCEAVEMHIEEEEAKLLPRIESVLDAEDRRNLAETMLEMKRIAPNHPHPHAPDTPPGAVLTGLIAKVADSGRDLVRQITSGDKAAGHQRVVRRAVAASKRVRQKSRSGKRKPRAGSSRAKQSTSRRSTRQRRARRR